MSGPDSARLECQPVSFTWCHLHRAPRQQVQVPPLRSTEALTPPWSGPAPHPVLYEISHTQAQCFPQTSWDGLQARSYRSLQTPPRPARSPVSPALFAASPAPAARTPRPLVYTGALPSPFDLQTQLLRAVSGLSGQRPSGGGRLLLRPGVTAPLCSHSPAPGHSQGAVRSLLLRAGCLDPFTHRHQAAAAHSSAAAQAAPAAPRGPLPAPGAALPGHAPRQLRVSPSRPLQACAIPRHPTLPACFASSGALR